jgi:hypothetical protein
MERGDLVEHEAMEVARQVLSENAAALYRLPG